MLLLYPMSPSLGLLPFQNLSTDLSGNYLADGITEERLTLLTPGPQLNVATRASGFFFKDKSGSSKYSGTRYGPAYSGRAYP